MGSKGNEDDIDKSNPWGSKYSESMCLEIIEMFSEGKTRSQFCAHHTISKQTFDNWKRKNPLFSKACEVAHEKARAYYDEMREDHLIQEFDLETKTARGLNHALFNRMYNARFNIPDKRSVNVKGLSKSKDERTMLKAIMSAIEKGELTPDEAQKLASIIDVSLKIKHTVELEERLEMLEKAQKTGFSDDEFEEVPDED